MAPIGHSATAQAETAIRDTIQSLYNVMLHTSAYDAAGPHTSLDALVAEVGILSEALRDVNRVSGPPLSLDSLTGDLPSVPRDLVQYVEAGRNPDIYTREFVELVRRTNQLRAGKRGAFAQFRDTLAGQIRSALPELSGDVDRVMEATAESPLPDAQQTATTQPTQPAQPTTDAPFASASPPPHSTPSGSDTGSGPAAGSGAATIDMLGILPSTPQASAAAGAAAGGATGAAGEPGAGEA